MNSNTFRMPARRLAVVATATALAAGPAALAGAGPAQATGGDQGRGGSADAVVLRTGLDVSLLNKTVNVPLKVALNEVRAPGSAEKTALAARLDAVDGGKPFSVLRADVATAKATVRGGRAEGRSNLARAKVHVPGLPLLSLVEVEQVTSKAVCEAGKRPVAEANLLGGVTVLGKKVTLTAGQTAEVKVPGVGEVRLDLSQTRTTSRTAVAAALELKVSVNPLKLNVAEVEGTVTLAGAGCSAPASAPAGEREEGGAEPQGEREKPAKPATDTQPKASEANLAETGGSSMTPYVAGGAVVLLLAGAGGVALARRGRG
ncbi:MULTISPECIES: SCO1860 family LAETG-anchored protein [Streptomyces]|uniref:SCO1860 family LAETG-anchored protein n=1 Tax=Streptomyces TaxID=1883 RepID=UPI001E35AF67|nr:MULTISPECIES: SCO1860 family LAETG-anchored protein [Streptomyces]UFQ14895.1 LPXTG cell wall anchor domain-containing protein [Streptomyces huasconensis]WCL84500.1 LPXTG cell wall anchor domain-containing protein [Streptomyces sp. JCM 35825]